MDRKIFNFLYFLIITKKVFDSRCNLECGSVEWNVRKIISNTFSSLTILILAFLVKNFCN